MPGKRSDTKERIAQAALELFSRRGFSAVSVRDISSAVGIRESAMYRHFDSKRDLFDYLAETMAKKSGEYFAAIQASPTDEQDTVTRRAQQFAETDPAELALTASSVFHEYLRRPDVIRFWRMISIERFSSAEAADFWNRELFDVPLAYQEKLFVSLMDAGAMDREDPRSLALSFYAPALMLYIRALPYEEGHPVFEESENLYRRHVHRFIEEHVHAPSPEKSG